MKAGIITFHWASNYGAVLQTYALQEKIKELNVEVEIIDYMPKRYERKLLKCFVSRNLQSLRYKLNDYFKAKKIQKDIWDKLSLSSHYNSADALKQKPPIYDVYISGSDQIWNEHFTLAGEGKTTLSYFLDFAPAQAHKISYATSIGTDKLSDKYWESAVPMLKEYDMVGVRERSAKRILKENGIEAVVLPDPTILLKAQNYATVFKKMPSKVVYYILQNNQTVINEMKLYLENNYAKGKSVNINKVTLSEWGGYIANAEYVLTNSYHGIIFSILHHRIFFAVLIEGELEGMNDRVITLLERLELQNRIISDENELEKARKEKIDWDRVDNLLDIYRQEGNLYLERYFNSEEC